MTGETKNVFISHVHKDDAKLAVLKRYLKIKGMHIRDASITSDKPNNAKSPEYIKSAILTPQIKWASTMIVYITPETKDSDWVNWEIKKANELGKTIVGVWEKGAHGCEVPEALDEYGDALVGWNADKIITAINGDYEKFEEPDGTPCTSRPIRRHPCG